VRTEQHPWLVCGILTFPSSFFPPSYLVWTKFLKGDQQYRDARLKLLPVVVDGPWIVKTAVGSGKSPALLGKVIPLQYFFRDPDRTRKGVYEVDVIITASSIAKGILSVVKGHTNSVSIAFAFIIEAAEQDELPETVLCCKCLPFVTVCYGCCTAKAVCESYFFRTLSSSSFLVLVDFSCLLPLCSLSSARTEPGRLSDFAGLRRRHRRRPSQRRFGVFVSVIAL